MVDTAKLPDPVAGATRHPDLTVDLSNAPNREETLFAIGQLKALQAEKAELVKKHKGIRNALKLQGHVLQDLEHQINVEKQLDDTELATLKNRARIAQFMGLPVGSQISFIDVLSGAAPSQQDLETRAYDDGYKRGLLGSNIDEQAFPLGTQEYEHHVRGWHDGQRVLLDKAFKLKQTVENVEAQEAIKKVARAKVKKSASNEDEATVQ
jgi:hypothetical protein